MGSDTSPSPYVGNITWIPWGRLSCSYGRGGSRGVRQLLLGWVSYLLLWEGLVSGWWLLLRCRVALLLGLYVALLLGLLSVGLQGLSGLLLPWHRYSHLSGACTRTVGRGNKQGCRIPAVLFVSAARAWHARCHRCSGYYDHGTTYTPPTRTSHWHLHKKNVYMIL